VKSSCCETKLDPRPDIGSAFRGDAESGPRPGPWDFVGVVVFVVLCVLCAVVFAVVCLFSVFCNTKNKESGIPPPTSMQDPGALLKASQCTQVAS
jgi:hypothetical protein